MPWHDGKLDGLLSAGRRRWGVFIVIPPLVRRGRLVAVSPLCPWRGQKHRMSQYAKRRLLFPECAGELSVIP